LGPFTIGGAGRFFGLFIEVPFVLIDVDFVNFFVFDFISLILVRQNRFVFDVHRVGLLVRDVD
jgi:hypothetical protein